MKYVVTKQHYDMAPGTVLYAVDPKPQAITNELLTSITKDGKNLRLIPAEKVKVDEEYSPFETVNS